MPRLWKVLTDTPPPEILARGSTMATTSRPNEEGRMFLTAGETSEFERLLRKKLGTRVIQIRKPNFSEIQYFWSEICFDIEEPLFIAEIGNKKLLVNFIVTDGKLEPFWFDLCP